MFDLVINSSIPKYLIPNKNAPPYALLNCLIIIIIMPFV